jgi:hypothetical protein
VLEEGEGDHRHEDVAVQAGPGAALEVIEAEFLLQLLMRLLAGPARLDGSRQDLQLHIGGEVGEVVLRLS